MWDVHIKIMHCLPASEIGEPVAETVRREVMEEVGLKVGRLHYYKSQPWSFTDTLLMGFFAELEGGEDISY